jgi:DNA modification methylase
MSLDGGETSEGPLWHAISPRWGHSMHTMCSYHGMFPARLVHYFLHRYSSPGDIVLDPFSGRGTTTLQAKVEGRRTISNDLSPLGYVLSSAKANPPSWAELASAVDSLERSYKPKNHQDLDVSNDIRMLFHDNTLRQLLFLQDRLLKKPLTSWSPSERMLAGTVAGILHGGHRNDGTSMYLSISMPNTFSMAPGYVEKFIAENGLKKIDQDVFERLRDKLSRIYMDSVEGPPGIVHKSDAARLLGSKDVSASSVDLVITSPPYLKVVNYGTSNWIRLWWLGVNEVSRHSGAGRLELDAELDHRHSYASYSDFMLRTMKSIRRVLKPDGVGVIVIGDVQTPNRPTVDLAEQIWNEVGASSGLELLDLIEDNLAGHNSKVSRIWGETRGNATDRDCILVVARQGAQPSIHDGEVDWDEPYKDGGPDVVHQRLKRQRIAS